MELLSCFFFLINITSYYGACTLPTNRDTAVVYVADGFVQDIERFTKMSSKMSG